MWPYSWTHVGTPSHLGHMDRVAATMPSQAHAGAAQEAPNIGQWEGQDVPLVRPSSCIVKGGILSSQRYLPTYLGCESPDGYLEPAAVKEDADDQLSEIASTIPPVDPSSVELKHSAFLAQLLLEEVDLESTSEPTSPVGKPVLHMQHTHSGEHMAQSPDTLARPASNNMPLSEHDTQMELRRLLYLKAEGIERQERLQYLRQTWKSSIWSEDDDDSYTLPDPEIPLVYSLHYGQQCPPEWDDGSVPAETADRQ